MGFSICNKIINTSQCINGFHIGNITIKSDATLIVDGFIIGNVHIDLNAKLIINGFMIGHITGHAESAIINGFIIGSKHNSKPREMNKKSALINNAKKIKSIDFRQH